MNISDFKYITTLDSGNTTQYEKQLIEYFKIDTNQTIEQVGKELEKHMKVEPILITKKYYKFNNKLWKVCIPLLDETFDQWSRMETLLAEGDNIRNMNKLLAIYFRPVNILLKQKPFKLKYQEKIEEEILNMDMNLANGLMLFFSIRGLKYMNNIKAFSLNQLKLMKTQEPIQNK
jgi:hypothetical protein